MWWRMWRVVLFFTDHACGPCGGPSELTLGISLHFHWVVVGNKVEKLWYDFWASIQSWIVVVLVLPVISTSNINILFIIFTRTLCCISLCWFFNLFIYWTISTFWCACRKVSVPLLLLLLVRSTSIFYATVL